MLTTMARRSVYSHYLPLKRHARAASRSASLNKDTARSPTKEKDARNGRTSSTSQTSKRRSTLNSREAGYDEAEALRRAIEASKEDAIQEQSESGNRRPKRGRSDSQEYVGPLSLSLSLSLSRARARWPWRRVLTSSQEAGRRQKTENEFSVGVAVTRQKRGGFGRRWNDRSQRGVEI